MEFNTAKFERYVSIEFWVLLARLNSIVFDELGFGQMAI